MKTALLHSPRTGSLTGAVWAVALALALGGPSGAGAAPFGVPVRVQFNFILNASGNRPSSGDLNTDEEVEAQVTRANQILAAWTSELRIHSLGIQEVSGASQYYLASANSTDRDNLRASAMADPSRYHWRNDAVNIYITAASDSAISKFPPDNDIILVCQSIFNTTIMHELGHSLSLYHTHETCCGGDGCDDTIEDNDRWDRDDIALNNFGQVYANLTSGQKYQVDMVWSNLMSYHNGDYRWMISNCQHDKMSAQAYSDRTWLLTKVPVYVDAAWGGSQNGSFSQPYRTIQNAINAGALNNRVLVLEYGTHDNPSSLLRTATDVVTRKGTSTIRESKPDYDLPYNLEDSKNPNVRAAILAAQQSARQKDVPAVIRHLLEAEKHATGRERDAIRLELAQRYRDSDQLDQAAAWFDKLAAEADQPGLRRRSQNKAQDVRALAKQKQEQARQQAEQAPGRQEPRK